MKKLVAVPVIMLVFLFCSGYSKLSTDFCTRINGNDLVRQCWLVAKGSTNIFITPAENIYAHTSGQSRLYRSSRSPVNSIMTHGGGRIIP